MKTEDIRELIEDQFAVGKAEVLTEGDNRLKTILLSLVEAVEDLDMKARHPMLVMDANVDSIYPLSGRELRDGITRYLKEHPEKGVIRVDEKKEE